MTRHRHVPPLRDIPLDGPVSPTVTRPRTRRLGVVALEILLLLIAVSVVAVVLVSPETVADFARAFAGQ